MMLLLPVALAIPATAFAVVTPGDGTSIANGKATLVSNSSVADSWLSFDDLNGQAPAALNELSATVESGTGWGGGSPRFQVRVTNATKTHNIFVYLGDAPSFTSGNPGDTGNLLNAGLRVDSTQIGGLFYGTWADALDAANAGGYNEITGITLVVDASWLTQTFVFDSVSINGKVNSFGPVCKGTGFERDGINLTAAQIGGTVTGNLDATGCDIGVYYGPGTAAGKVDGARISNARYFGVVNDGGTVDVTNSIINNIGDSPFDGTQHGVGILYTTEHNVEEPEGKAGGTIIHNELPSYQKGGITVRGAGASATIENNTLTGSGMVDYIAQNGIQVSFGGSATVKGNTVSGNWYTPTSNTACGLLFYQAAGVKQQANNLFGNEMNLCNVGRGGGNTSL
jgi:hypothetical protein